MDVAKAVQEIKAGKVEFRVDKTGIIHAPVGKLSFGAEQARGQRRGPDRRRAEGQAQRGQGQVRQGASASPRRWAPASRSTRPRRSPPRRPEETRDHAFDPQRQRADARPSTRAASPRRPHAFLLGYQGITVPQVTELRDEGARERRRVRGGEEHAGPARHRQPGAGRSSRSTSSGPTAVVFSREDPVALAKALTDFAKDVPAIKFKAGLVEGRADRRRPDQGHRRAAQPRGADREAAVPAAVADHALRPGAGRRAAVVRGGAGPGPDQEGRASLRRTVQASRIRNNLRTSEVRSVKERTWLSRPKISSADRSA